MIAWTWALSLPQSLQFSSSYTLRKLFASQNRESRAYFSAKWRLSFYLEPVELNALLGTVRFTRFFPFGFVVFKDNYGKMQLSVCTACCFMYTYTFPNNER